MPSASTRRIRWSCAETVGNAGAYERGPCLCCQINPVELIAGELRHPEGGFIRGEPQTIGLAEALQHGRDGGLVRSQVVDAAPRLCGRSLEVGEVQAALSLKLPRFRFTTGGALPEQENGFFAEPFGQQLSPSRILRTLCDFEVEQTGTLLIWD